MKTIILSPELASLNLFYLGLIFLILGSIARRWIVIRKVKAGALSTPTTDGTHSIGEMLVMFPLKAIGYFFAMLAIGVQIHYSPDEFVLPIWYFSIITIHFWIPRLFRPQKGHSERDNWVAQIDRLKAARVMYAISILIVPTSIFAESFIITQLLLLIVFFYEIFFFSSKEATVWLDSARFDLENSEPTALPTED